MDTMLVTNETTPAGKKQGTHEELAGNKAHNIVQLVLHTITHLQINAIPKLD